MFSSIPRLPETTHCLSYAASDGYKRPVDNLVLKIGGVSKGNPIAVLLLEDIYTAPVATLGPAIECHPNFPQRVNVGFMQVLNRKEINLRVFERGAGETLACGSGACAAMVSGQLQGLLDQRITAHLSGGSLTLEWRGEGHPVMMTGPASNVFEGQINI